MSRSLASDPNRHAFLIAAPSSNSGQNSRYAWVDSGAKKTEVCPFSHLSAAPIISTRCTTRL